MRIEILVSLLGEKHLIFYLLSLGNLDGCSSFSLELRCIWPSTPTPLDFEKISALSLQNYNVVPSEFEQIGSSQPAIQNTSPLSLEL